MKKRFFISNAIDEEKLPFISNEEMKFGRAHYSWKIVADLYSKGLEAADIETHRVVRPEIYQSKIAQETFGVRHDDNHLAVKPIEHIRPFPGMRNIFIGGWEFPQFSNESFDGNPLNNHVNILKHADQIWCWSNFTRNNIKALGIDTAITLPPPVIVPRVSDDLDIDLIATLALNTTRAPVLSDVKTLGEVLKTYEKSKVFFSVFNPYDRRKQIKSMMTAFEMAQKKQPEMVLIVKLVIDNINTTLGTIQEILSSHHGFTGNNNRIIFIGDILSDGQMKKLVKMSDFYLCTSSTEGLNLPIIEAMAQGLVPISTKATAMADYINENNSIVMEHEELPTEGPYHAFHSHLPTTHFPPKLESAIDALISAAKISQSKYQVLSENAKKDAQDKYSLQAFIRNIHASGVL